MDKKKTILLIEDDMIIAKDEALTISGYGFHVIISRNGFKGVETVRSNPDIDLVLTDIDLGTGMDGTQVAEEILKIRDLPVIFLTSNFEKEMMEKVKGITKYGYVMKTSGEFVLIETIHMALRLFEASRELKKSIAERENIENVIRENESRYHSFFESSKDSIFVSDMDNLSIIDANPAASRMYGYSLNEFLKLKILDITEEKDKTREAIRKKQDYIALRNHIKKDGTVFPVEISGSYFKQKDRLFHTAYIRDITERIKAENEIKLLLEEQELLLKEVHHRIKNDMNIISGLISIHNSTSDNPEVKSVLKSLTARINVMFNIYKQLYRRDDYRNISLKHLINDLINNIEKLYVEIPEINIETDVEDMDIERKISFPIGIIINELITNIYKYAFKEDNKDRKRTIILTAKRNSRNMLVFKLTDSGSGFPDEILNGKGYGFGLKLVEMLSHQINCRLKLYNNMGSVTELEIPVTGKN